MSVHKDPHPQAGTTVTITRKDSPEPVDFRLEDWFDRVAGTSWMFADGNFAAMKYGMRSGFSGLPTDDEVVYGKVGAFGEADPRLGNRCGGEVMNDTLFPAPFDADRDRREAAS